MLKVIPVLVFLACFQAGFALECGEDPQPISSPEIHRLVASMKDSSVSVREKSARKLSATARGYRKDSNLYDTLVSYALENLLTYSHLKFDVGLGWLIGFGDREIPAICRRYKREKDYSLRRALITSLEGKKNHVARSVLKAALEDEDSSIVVEAIRVYGRAKFDDSYSFLLESINSDNLLYKVGGVRGLAYFKSPKVVRLLLDSVVGKNNVEINRHFSLEYSWPVNSSAEYIVDTLSPKRGTTLHEEAFCTIEAITGEKSKRDTSRIATWVRKNEAQRKRPRVGEKPPK